MSYIYYKICYYILTIIHVLYSLKILFLYIIFILINEKGDNFLTKLRIYDD